MLIGPISGEVWVAFYECSEEVIDGRSTPPCERWPNLLHFGQRVVCVADQVARYLLAKCFRAPFRLLCCEPRFKRGGIVDVPIVEQDVSLCTLVED